MDISHRSRSRAEVETGAALRYAALRLRRRGERWNSRSCENLEDVRARVGECGDTARQGFCGDSSIRPLLHRRHDVDGELEVRRDARTSWGRTTMESAVAVVGRGMVEIPIAGGSN